MADLNKVRVQVLDPTTGSVIENVDVKTSDGAVYLPDGTTLRNWISDSEEARAYIQKIVVEHLTTQHVDAGKVDSVITAVDFDANTGIFTFTRHDGSTKEVDTTLEKLPIAFDCINGAGIEGYTADDILLEITLDDSTKKYVKLSDLIDIYTGGDTSEISVNVDETNNNITATLVDGGITNSKIAIGTIARDKIDSAFETQIADIEGILDVDTNRGKTINTIVTDGINSVLGGSTETVDSLNTKIENKITKDDVAVDVNLGSDDNTTVISVSGLENPTLYTKVGVAVPEQGISVAVNSPSGVAATINYQWYYKNVGTDSDFVTLTGATTATLPSASIPVDIQATTIYYCVVTATGEGVNATPVASKKITVVVV